MKIEELLERYFEGQTSCEEERELRCYFTKGEVPEHLEIYRSLFAYLNQEAANWHDAQSEKEELPCRKTISLKYRLAYILGSVAAGLLLLMVVTELHKDRQIMPQNFVVIDGKQYTDVNLIHEQALAAFRDVSISENEILDLMFE